MSRVFLCGMSGPESLEDLRELIEPIKQYFDGIVWVLHDSIGSEEERYLNGIKGAGRIIPFIYCKRHDFSRNVGLYCGGFENGDFGIDCDQMERISPMFASNLKMLIQSLSSKGFNCASYFGKHFIFQYHESLRYQGNPHEGMVRDDHGLRNIELSQFFPNETDVRYGVRNIKRPDKFHFVAHYAKYFLFPWGSNHALLGLEHRGNVAELFPKREELRLNFLEEMRKRGFPRTLDGLKDMLSQTLDDTLKIYLNVEKVWQDYYRYEILRDKTTVDEHDWTSMVKIP